MIKNILMSCAVLIFLAGCGDPAIDGSTDQTFESSSQKVADSLSEAQKEKFGQAIVVLAISYTFENMGQSAEETSKKFREKMHGKTADDIIALAEDIQKQPQ